MHFPPGDDGDEALVSIDVDDDTLSKLDNDPSKSGSNAQSTFTSWTEPALRSDRLCWSLVGFAHSLAYEMGLFGSFAEAPPVDGARSQRLGRILYIYLSQTCGRLGFSSMFHSITGEDSFASLEVFLFDRKHPIISFPPSQVSHLRCGVRRVPSRLIRDPVSRSVL